MTSLSVLFSVLLFISFIGIVSFSVKIFHREAFMRKKILILLGCILVFSISLYFFVPFHPSGYEDMILDQHIYWSGSETDITLPACKQPDHLPEDLLVRRYNLTDWPAPGHSIGTLALHVELELENGNSCILILTPKQVTSSRIYLYDNHFGARTFFLTKQSALKCLSLFAEGNFL